MLFSTSTEIINLIEASTSTAMLSECKVQEEVGVEFFLSLRDFALVFNPFLSPSFHLRQGVDLDEICPDEWDSR